MMKFLQKLGKSLMLPVACLPLCGLLMGIGYALCPSTMQGGDVTGFLQLLGLFLVKAGAALIDNMALLFVIGVGVGMSKEKLSEVITKTIVPNEENIGLYNVNSRLNLLYGDKCKICIESKEKLFTSVTIKIPFNYDENL